MEAAQQALADALADDTPTPQQALADALAANKEPKKGQANVDRSLSIHLEFNTNTATTTIGIGEEKDAAPEPRSSKEMPTEESAGELGAGDDKAKDKDGWITLLLLASICFPA